MSKVIVEDLIYAGIKRADERYQSRLERGMISREDCAIEGWRRHAEIMTSVQYCMSGGIALSSAGRDSILELMNTSLGYYNDLCAIFPED